MTSLPAFGWLLLGAGLQVFAAGKWTVPLAAWLAPVFLLHFTRSAPPVAGMVWVSLALAVALSLSHRGVIPAPGVAYFGVAAAAAVTMALPFLADRLLAPRRPGLLSLLLFPAAWVAFEFVSARLNPFGSWGALAYTQHGNLPLMQLAAVTGIWGIAFLVAWFAAVVNWAWDHQFAWGSIKGGVLLYAAAWTLVMLAGGARLALAPAAPTVRVAGIGWPEGIIEQGEFMRALAPDFTPAERDRLRATLARLHDSFFERSRLEAEAGARIIVWPEANLIVLDEDEAPFLERARAFARENEVFLLAGVGTLHLGAPRPVANQAIFLDPDGRIRFSYVKTTAVPGFEAETSIRGQEPLPVTETGHGRIAAAICFDLDFPALIRQVGRAGADLLLVPASDWQAIARLHQPMAEFRAIENGVAMFRITRWGGSGAVDRYGRRLAEMDDFAARDPVMVAQVPAGAGARTVYARIGDAFGWLCIAGLLLAIAGAVLGRGA